MPQLSDQNQMTVAFLRLSYRSLQKIKKDLSSQPDAVTEFDESMWSALMDFVTVNTGDKVMVTFRDGTEIKVNIG